VPSSIKVKGGALNVTELHWAKPTMGLRGIAWASAHPPLSPNLSRLLSMGLLFRGLFKHFLS
jgi:hypothetical protein